MDPLTIGAGISALGGLAGGLLQSDNQSRINSRNRKQAQEFAQKSIQWRVDDAKKAGIHPLYALGAQTSSPATAVGDNSGAMIGQSLGKMGQALAQGLMKKKVDYESQMQSHTLKNMRLRNYGLLVDNQMKELEFAKMRHEQSLYQPKDTIFYLGGIKLHYPGSWAKAQDIEDMFGDMPSGAYGATMMAKTLQYNLKKGYLSKKQYNQLKKEYGF